MHTLVMNKTGALGLLLFDAIEEALDGLSPSSAAFLLTALYRPGSTTTQLAMVAGITQPTGVRLLNGLEKRGWIEPRTRDGKTSPVFLSPAGESRARRLQEARLGIMQRLLKPLSASELDAFEHAADKIMAGATRSRAFARTTCRLCDHPACNDPECPIGGRAGEIEADEIRTASKGHA